MKKYAKGKFVVTRAITCFIMIIIFIFSYILGLLGFLDVGFFWYIFLFICMFIVLQEVVRIFDCFYVLDGDTLDISFLTIKKRTKWYDFMTIGRTAIYSYQKEHRKIKYKDILSIDLYVKEYVTRYIWKKKLIFIELKNDEGLWIVDDVFSKKQLREIIKCIQEKNPKIIMGEALKKDFYMELLNEKKSAR